VTGWTAGIHRKVALQQERERCWNQRLKVTESVETNSRLIVVLFACMRARPACTAPRAKDSVVDRFPGRSFIISCNFEGCIPIRR
jgi:hypothetical protein